MLGSASERWENHMGKTTVLVADDHPLLRDGIVHLLEKEPDFEVVGQAADGEEAVRLVGETSPDVVLMDIEMPRVDGIDATRQIKNAYPDVSVIALTVHDGEEYITALLDAGAAGYLLKTTYGKELVQAVRVAHLGKFVMDDNVWHKLFRTFLPGSNKVVDSSLKNRLSAREMEVMRLVCRGKTNEETARDLGISLAAAKDHLSGIFSKLGVGSRTAAVIACLRSGILSMNDLSG